MSNILFLAHRIPFPPDRGDKIRSNHLLKALAALGDVHVGCFGDTDADMAAETYLARFAKTHLLLRRTKQLALAGLEALTSGKSVSQCAFAHPQLSAWVERTIAEQNIDTIFIFSGSMGQYVPAHFAGKVVVDLCDVDSAKFEAYGKDGRFPMALVHSREGKVLAAEEAALAERADVTILISDNEAALFRSRLPEGANPRIEVVRNGIDAALFDPAASGGRNPYQGSDGPHIVFTGQMDYAPNISAVERAAHALMPQIRKEFPQAQFHIVGRAPTDAVKALEGVNGTRVWGEVADVRPYLACSQLVLAPLTIARGIQNKVLEAMAMAKPVVLSLEAATGIDATDGAHFSIGRSDDDLTHRMLTLLNAPPLASAMGKEARKFVVEQQSWEAMLAPLAALIGHEAAEAVSPRCAA